MLMGWFSMSYEEAGRVTIPEFRVYATANRVRMQQLESTAALQAWYNQTAQNTKGTGKNKRSAYNTYKDYYDNEEAFQSIFRDPEEAQADKPKQLTLADRNRLTNQRRREELNV